MSLVSFDYTRGSKYGTPRPTEGLQSLGTISVLDDLFDGIEVSGLTRCNREPSDGIDDLN